MRRAASTVVSEPERQEVIDLTSPQPRRGRSRSRGSAGSLVDLTGASPAAELAADVSGDELPSLAERLTRRDRPAEAPPKPAAKPPRTLAEAGRVDDVRKRGLLPVGPQGQALCRYCRQELTPPKVRTRPAPSVSWLTRVRCTLPQRSFCSAACVHEHQLRSSSTYARQATFERDQGRCASCGLQAHLVYLAAGCAPPGCGLPPARRRRRNASAPVLKALLKATLPGWRASVKGKAKPLAVLLAETLAAAVGHVTAHAWPPPVLLAISSATCVDDAELALEEEDGDESADEGPDEAAAACTDAGSVALAARLATWLPANGFHTATRAGQLQTGHFWQMDHIRAVAEGGGSCGLDNLRTLCTPCHSMETALLAARRADARKASKSSKV